MFATCRPNLRENLEPSVNVEERKHNPFINSAADGRALSAMQLPFFILRPPAGYGVLTTTGRKTGKTRRRCVRAIRRDDKAYIVAIKGARTGWLKNFRANPEVRLRVKGGAFAGIAREVQEAAERQEAMGAYCETVNSFEYLEYSMWRKGRATPSKIKELHRTWFIEGTPLVVEPR
jgi:deazaflavin-dependent oxidoreductase (nitroreductase family)